VDKRARARATASTQEHLGIKDVRDDLIITSRGSAAMVLQTSSINFDLLAEYEQDNKIFAFAGLLNSLNFRIQILVRTKRIDISNYIDYLKANKEEGQKSEGLKKQLEIYTNFVQKLIIQTDVLDKTFYIIVPYSPGAPIPGANILDARKNKEEEQKAKQMKTDRFLEKAKIFLYPKRDHILKQLGRMGLFGHQLTTKELLSEFYTIYNPDED
jgi:hypothetical protein